MIAYLQKSEGSEGFHQIIDFLTISHIKYALTENPTIYVSLIEQFWQTATASTLKDGDMGITTTIDGKVKVVLEASIRRHLKLEDYDGISTLSTAEIFKQLALIGASKEYTGVDTPLFQTMLVQGQTLQGEGSTIPVAPIPHDPPLLRVHSLRSDEGNLTLNELTVLCTSLSKKVEILESDLKQTKQTYGAAYTKLIMKVKKLEHKVKSIKARRKVKFVISDDEDDLEDPSKQGRKIAHINEDEGITLVQMGAHTQGRSDEDLMYETGVYDYPEGFTGPIISITTAEPVTTAGEGVSTARAIPEEVSTAKPDMDVTLAEALVDLLKSGKKKSPKPKARGISFQDPEEVARKEVFSPPVSKISAKDKGKAIMTEPGKPLKKKDQTQSDEELALRLHAEEQAEFERLQKERATQEEASKAAIYDEMDNIQAIIEADEQLAARVQAEEQELYSIEEKSRLLVEMIAERKRFFAAQRAVEQRSKPPTKTQMRNRMKKSSKKKAGGSRKKTLAKKRAGEKQSKESSKRQKMKDDAEKEELRAHLDIIPGDDVAISVESLATKYPIVDWKIHILSEDKMYYEIIKANGSTKSYKIFIEMLDDFDRQDGDLITVFEPSKDDEVWKAQQDYTLISWRLFDSCGIHVLLMDTGIAIHMLVEKTYPLTQEMLSRMLSRKLEVDNESEMAFELLRFTRS
ncbi:hypothetical protein Tco_0589139 [Tanacetum coccineum]